MGQDEALTRAVETLGERLRDDLNRHLCVFTDDVMAAAKAAREALSPPPDATQVASPTATESVKPATIERSNEWLLRAVRHVDAARSLREILDALVECASEGAARAGVLLIQGGRARGWRFAGFPDSFDGAALDVALGETGMVAVAVDEKRPAFSDSDGVAPAFAGLGPFADGTEAMALPLALDGQVVAVLYVDQPDLGPGLAALDRPGLEVLTRHASRSLEALTAFKAVRAVARADTGSVVSSPAASAGAEAEEDEAARRYARLVISEIKLYHEDAVAAGRKAGDLAIRLGGEIARARAQYEQRVPPHLRGAAEHFHAELVRTLAGGDASLFEKVGVS